MATSPLRILDPNTETHSVAFSMKVTLEYKLQKLSIASYSDTIIQWYIAGIIDFKDIQDFTIRYNTITELFDVSYVTVCPNDNYTNMRLADPDVDGHFPIMIHNIPYNVIGTIV